MIAGVYNLSVEQGSTKSFQVVYKDSESQPIDLTGYSGRGQIRKRPSSPDIIASFVVTVTDPAAGVVDIDLPASALTGIRFVGDDYSEKTEYAYDIELYNNSGRVIRLLNGTCSISPEVTK